MKNSLKSTGLILMLISVGYSQQTKGEMKFEVSGFENDDGKAIINLYREQDDIPGEPYKTVSALITTGKSILVIDEIPFGDYAAIIYHDINNNDILDHKFFLPAEPMVFSNDWHLSLFSGFPTYEKLKFAFSADSTNYSMTID